MHIVLRQIPEEKREIDKVRKNKAGDSGTLADNPPPAEAAAAQVMHEMEQVLGPQPSTKYSQPSLDPWLSFTEKKTKASQNSGM